MNFKKTCNFSQLIPASHLSPPYQTCQRKAKKTKQVTFSPPLVNSLHMCQGSKPGLPGGGKAGALANQVSRGDRVGQWLGVQL